MPGDRKSGHPPRPAAPPVRLAKSAVERSGAPSASGKGLVRTRAASPEATLRRAPIRLLLRPAERGALGASVCDEPIIPMGAASRDVWGDAWRAGDEEAMLWVPAPRVNEVLVALREDPRIVEVRVSMRDVAK
ncbi:MAG TPA: hypothetical protein VGI39_09450 [Polyangiaceae bacterium]